MWDDGEVRSTLALEEKGSRVRRVTPNERLREALRRFVLHERGHVGPWLFPSKRAPHLPAAHVAYHVVARVCRRVGLQRVSPHTFRRYVVNQAMRSGHRLEVVQRWLGHASPSTTSRFYWTDDVAHLDMHVPMLSDHHHTNHAPSPNDEEGKGGGGGGGWWWEEA